LDRGHEIDIRQTLDTPPEDEEILYAADRWLTTLQEMEFRSESIIELLKARLAKLSNR
jgi:hypothetical protein